MIYDLPHILGFLMLLAVSAFVAWGLRPNESN